MRYANNNVFPVPQKGHHGVIVFLCLVHFLKQCHLSESNVKQINSLSDFPEKFRLVDDPVLASWGIRFVIVNGYLAFYTISEEENLIIVVRFLFQKSNWNAILRQGFSLV
jgi:plasmid stabilization system protein ParE